MKTYVRNIWDVETVFRHTYDAQWYGTYVHIINKLKQIFVPIIIVDCGRRIQYIVNIVNDSNYIVCLTIKDKCLVLIPYISTDVDLDIEG